MPDRFVIIGGGVNGLATAYALLQQNAGDITLLEQYRIGHSRGSSHSHGRIFRHFYHTPVYSDLALAAREVDWPQAEEVLGAQFLHDNPGITFGQPEGRFLTYCQNRCPHIQELGHAEAHKMFPQFKFPQKSVVLYDPKAAVIDALGYLRALKMYCLEKGVRLRENIEVESIESHDSLKVHTKEGPIPAERVIVTAGPWTSELLPLAQLVPIRQTVGYFKVLDSSVKTDMGCFPVWSSVGEESNDLFYGMPEFGYPGIKVARHIVSGDGHSPQQEGKVSDKSIKEILTFIHQTMAFEKVVPVFSENCFYTCTPSEDFVIDHLPHDPRIVVGAGFSGHGFKFAPTIGNLLADLAIEGRKFQYNGNEIFSCKPYLEACDDTS